ESFDGRATVNADLPGYRKIQTELETRGDAPPGDSNLTFFEGWDPLLIDQSLAEPSLGDTSRFNNDTYATAQYLGTAPTTQFGDQNIVLEGQLNNTINVNDGVDFYGVSLLAGQTVTVQLTTIPIVLSDGSQFIPSIPIHVGI